MKLFDLKKDDYFCFAEDLRTELVLPVYRVIRERDNARILDVQFFNVRTGINLYLGANKEVHKLNLELKWRFHDNG